MNVGLLDESEARQFQLARIQTGDWWIIPWISAAAEHVSNVVEEAYYSGVPSKGFELMTGGPPGMPTVAFARKTDMPPEELAQLIVGLGGFEGSSLDSVCHMLNERDVLILFDGPQPSRATGATVVAWSRWLGVPQ